MTPQDSKLVIAGLVSFLAAPAALGHVPYLEGSDFTQEDPFRVRKTIEQSIAVYSWLEVVNGQTDDVDVYQFTIDEPTRVFVESLVPVCPSYEEFLPWFAIVGPGLPDPEYGLPIDLAEGYGAIVVPNYEPGEDRPQFFEPFGGKSYYDGPEFNQTLSTPGTYYVVYWDPADHGAPSNHESGCCRPSSGEPQELPSCIDRFDICGPQSLAALGDLIQNQQGWASPG
jgi:hypothetical protein